MKFAKMIPMVALPIGFGEMFSLSRTLAFGNLFSCSTVTDFEKKLANYIGSKRVFACNSGRTALYMALKALGLKTGDEVLVPAYTCGIVFEMIFRAGLRPAFVDVVPETYNLDPQLIPEMVTSKTRAIIPVHLFGYPCNMDPIVEAADKYGLYIVEDAAQALGAEYKGQKAGSFGDLVIFSFGPGKSVMGGEGGAIAINNTELTESVESLLFQLSNPDLRWELHVAKNILAMKMFSNEALYAFVKGSVDSSIKKMDEMTIQNCLALSRGSSSDLNPTLKPSKMPEASAAVIIKQLEKLDDLNRMRIMNANKLISFLEAEDGKSIRLPQINSDVKNTFTRFPIQVMKGKRNLVMNEMLRRGVDVKELYYYVDDLLHGLSRTRFPTAEALTDCLMALPNHPLLTEADLEKISESLILSLQVT